MIKVNDGVVEIVGALWSFYEKNSVFCAYWTSYRSARSAKPLKGGTTLTTLKHSNTIILQHIIKLKLQYL